MSELSFEQMLEESLKTIRNGEVVEGTVIDVKEDEIILNIGYKADGILTKNEYSNDSSIDLTTVVKPGDTMEVKVTAVIYAVFAFAVRRNILLPTCSFFVFHLVKTSDYKPIISRMIRSLILTAPTSTSILNTSSPIYAHT